MAGVTPARVVVSGHVNGEIKKLLDRVESLSKKADFDVLIVAGNFFPEVAVNIGSEDESWMDDLMNGKYKHLPSIYILGPRTEYQRQRYWKMICKGLNDEEKPSMAEALSEGCDCFDGKISILGKKGLITCASGLTIAYFNGSEFVGLKESDIESFVSSSSKTDILVTPFWPKGISSGSTASVPEAVSLRSSNGSHLVSKLVSLVKPRYIISASTADRDHPTGIFYERQPYRNHIVLQESQKPVTRFISLGSVSNDKKAVKWLYAFNIKPMSSLIALDTESGKNEGRLELIRQPDDTTASPFEGMSLGMGSKKENEGNVQFFYQVNQPKKRFNRSEGEDRPNKRMNDQDRGEGRQEERIQGRNDNQRQPRDEQRDHQRQQQSYEPRNQGKDPSSCWFCLASPDVKKEYIISIGSFCYLSTAKGGLVKDHLLILPIEHLASSLQFPGKEVGQEMQKFKTSLMNFFDKEKKFVIFFERNFRSPHMQLQVVPVPVNALDLDRLGDQSSEQPEEGSQVDGGEDSSLNKDGKVREKVISIIIRILRRHKLNWRQIPSELKIEDAFTGSGPYFFMEIPYLSIQFLVFVPKRDDNIQFPMHLGRTISAEILGLQSEEVNDWKRVTESLTPNEEAQRAIDFRDRFKPFDFTLEDDDD